MKLETYNFEIRTLIAQMIDAFDDIVIRRYNNHVDRNIEDKIMCNFVYSPKGRTLHDLINKAKHIKLPVISVSISSINRNVNRVFNKLDASYYNRGPDDTGFAKLLQPVPVDLTINMSIITRFQSDMDQIITNFAPYNDPYIVISWIEPYTGHEIRNIVKWSGNINLQYPTDIGPNVPYRCVADTSFTIEGWVFKAQEEAAGKIYKIDTSFTALKSLNAKYDDLVAMVDVPLNTDVFVLSGRPQVTMANPYLTVPCVSDKKINIYGTWFDTLCSLYVSGSEGVFENQTWYDPASGNYRISAMYPGFSGIELSNWDVASDSLLTFTMPSAVSAGYIDVICFNEAGYGILTQDAVRPTHNPYVSGSFEYDSYVEYQHPSVNGIEVAAFYDNCE